MPILGFVKHAGGRSDPDATAAYVQRHAAPGALALRPGHAGAAAYVSALQGHEAGGVCVALHGQPRWRTQREAGPASAASIHAAYLANGPRLLEDLLGSFALVVVDSNAERTLLAIDRMGIERLAYAQTNDLLAFGTSAEQIAQMPAIGAAVRGQGIYDFLMLHMIPAPDTIFERVHKLQPASVATLERGKLEVRRYWLPQFRERDPEPFERLRDDLHASLADAVRSSAPDAATGSFLSGGLDSSTVSGVLGKVTTGPARTFSIGFGVAAYNELQYADIASRHFGTQATQYHVTADDVVTAFPLIAAAYDEPFGNSSAVPTYFCARRAAEQGVTHLLAGDGGDEIFGGNERYARQQVFDFYYKFPAIVRSGLLQPASKVLAAGRGFKPFGKFVSYVEQARIPLPERLESWNFVYREGSRMLEPQFAASVDPRAPFRLMHDVYAAAPCESTLNKMLYYDWQLTLADSDLRKVNTMCELAGVKVSYPMLDARVVDLSNRVTPAQKMERLELRSFFKKAMRGFLPAEILDKTKHGFGLPFGDWLKSDARLADLIYSHLHDLKARRFVRPAFLDELIDSQRSGHAMYYGYAIWDLAMLEAWFKAHAPRA
jgi:asparagine synthase (glutamine-hydrolysing)